MFNGFRRYFRACTGLLLVLSLQPAVSEEIYRLHTQNTQIDILVWKRGLLAGFGHNHVISAAGIEGRLVLVPGQLTRSRFELSFPVDALLIDAPDARKRFKDYFSKPISTQARQATRANMLKKIFTNKKSSRIIVRSAEITGPGPGYLLRLRVSFNGVQRKLVARVELRGSAAELEARGRLRLDLRRFGIRPVSAALGTIRIGDTVDIYFRCRLALRRRSDGKLEKQGG